MSDRDASIFESERELDEESVRRAQRAVASHSIDADDCRTLLSMLGIPLVPADSETLSGAAGAETV
ncbi:hypothetical protein [Rhodococcus jostii]|uniref:Uncharacterized protein n=1 Tax=Rhodococcus jostii TaxID=132919 RepID=A0A1H5CS87_RHOJO|nr:hypothetical protein [Rhodococcus jostii]SED69496.1 hypothetical protein SAMN04490220_5235 [Rhodococcus jostii]